jgi:putative ABC transport system substrate-binding protein
VQSLAHPGGNVTGFAVMEPSLGAKLLGMLKEIAPQVTHVAILMNPDNETHKRILALLEAAAPGFSVNIVSASARETADIETAMTQWGQQPGYGVIVPSDPITNSRRKLFIELAARYRLPAIYALRAAVADGGLMSYGVDLIELFRQAAIYADRILKGAKPADLPCAIADQVRAGGQLEDRQDTQPGHTADAACDRRRRNRIDRSTSAIGTFRALKTH